MKNETIKTAPAIRQFRTEIRGDCVYVAINGNATGPCFSLCEEYKAIRYANMLNRLGKYPEFSKD